MNRDQIISLFVAVYLAVYVTVGVDTFRWLLGGPVSLLPACWRRGWIIGRFLFIDSARRISRDVVRNRFCAQPQTRVRDASIAVRPHAPGADHWICSAVDRLHIDRTHRISRRVAATCALATVGLGNIHRGCDAIGFPIVPTPPSHVLLPHNQRRLPVRKNIERLIDP